MNPYHQFLRFDPDQKICCIQIFKQELIFMSTPEEILIYDLSSNKVVQRLSHMNLSEKRQNKKLEFNSDQDQNKQQKQRQQQQQQQQQYALQMHYFRSQLKHQIGHLIVHYKLLGIGIYEIVQQQTSTNNSTYKISFIKLINLKLPSAFLKLCFNNQFYKQITSLQNKKQLSTSIRQNLQKYSENQIQQFIDYQLFKKPLNKPTQFFVFVQQTPQFSLIKKFQLSHKNHSNHSNNSQKIQLLIHQLEYQLDQQNQFTNNNSLATATFMKYFQVSVETPYKRNLKYLIMAIQGGILYLYQLPEDQREEGLEGYHKNKQEDSQEAVIQSSKKTSSLLGCKLNSLISSKVESRNNKKQYILSSSKTLNLKTQITKLIQQNQKNPTKHSSLPKLNQSNSDFSVISFQLLDDLLALIAVRKVGVFVVDLRKFEIVEYLENYASQNKIKAQSQLINKLSNIRLTKTINKSMKFYKRKSPNPHQGQQSFSHTQRILKLQTQLLTTTFNKLKLLQIQIFKVKSLSPTSISNQPDQQYKITSKIHTFEQLNTKMIQNLIIFNNKTLTTTTKTKSQNKQNQSTVNTDNFDKDKPSLLNQQKSQIIALGNIKQDKIFYLIL